jgi:ferredoxin-NADP reductase
MARQGAPQDQLVRATTSRLVGGAVALGTAAALELRRRRSRTPSTTHPEAPPRPEEAMVRRTLARITTPLLPDDYLHLLNPLWSARELRGRVVDVVPETDDAATLVIQPGWGWRPTYRAGQYVGIGVDVDGRWHWRSYSVTSVPEAGRPHLTITVKAMPEGFLSSHLVRGLRPGTVVRLALPAGDFVLPDPPPPRILFWTGGSGVTPVMAMLRTLDRRRAMPDVVHVHAAPSAEASLFRDERLALAERHPGLRLVEVFDDVDGRLSTDDLPVVVPDWAERQAWVCGPTPLLDAAETHWSRAGQRDRLHLERFTLDRRVTGSGGRVVFSVSGKEVEVDGATTLLEAGESVGLSLPFGCRMGICHTCVLPLVEGTVTDLRDGSQYQDHQGIQTCINAPAGDCVLEA